MNTDRFLTRVFDKQEKKMLYIGDYIKLDGEGYKYYFGIYNDAFILHREIRNSDLFSNEDFYLKDRFIPMQCRGLLSKNKKMIYEDDIGHMEGVFGKGDDRIISMYNGKFCFKNRDNDGTIIIHDDLVKCINIIGNKWEHPALLEEKQ